MSETTLRAGAGWGTTTVDCGVNYNGNLDRGEVGVSGIKIDCGSGISWPTIVAICFIGFCVSPPNEIEGTVGLRYAKRAIISPIYCQRQSAELVLGIGTTARRNLTVYGIRVL